jgi:hypothetical protein
MILGHFAIWSFAHFNLAILWGDGHMTTADRVTDDIPMIEQMLK